MEYRKSVCPHDCPDACGLVVGVENGRVQTVQGDPDHPLTRGTVCVKMTHYPARQNAEHRLLHPMKRVGAKGEGRFSRVSWDQALDDIVERYRNIIAEYGGQAVLPYSYAGTMGLVQYNGGHPFFHKIGASRLERTICSAALEAGYNASLGPVPSAEVASAADSDLILIWGSNTLSTNVHAWPFFKAARDKGASIIAIDPYRNDTAARSDRHLRIRPGTDAALALGLMHVLVAEDMMDRNFLENWTVGFDRLEPRLREYPPEKVEDLTGVPAEEVRRLAREYGRARAPYIRLGWGPGRQINGGMAIRTISLLPALVGAFHKNGGCFTRSMGAGPKMNVKALIREDLSPGEVRAINMVELGHALTRPLDPPVKALHVYHSNPAVVAPDSSRVLAGLSRDDLFIVVHEHFITETAKYADILLPAATMFETTDLYRSYGHNCIQMTRPVVPPRGEARPTLAIFQDLARRFGFDEDVFQASEDELIRRVVPWGRPWFEGIDFDRLAACDPIPLRVPANPYLEGFATPSGKVEFYSESMAAAGLDPLPDGAPARDLDAGDDYPLQLITPPRREFLNSTFCEVEALRDKAGPPVIMIHPDDASPRAVLDGEPVSVRSARGEITLYARVTEKVMPGVTVIEGLYSPEYMMENKGVNHLTSQNLTDMGRSCAFHCNRVEVFSRTAC